MDSSSQLYSTNTTKPMGEAVSTSSNSRRRREMESLSLEISKYPKDLLTRFLGNNPSTTSTRTLDEPNIGGDEDEDDGGLNLGLGLSLGGKFGVDKSRKGLIRSSSIVGTMSLIRDEDKVAPPPPAAVHGLVRTSSLPVETEEEWRKRKEIQTLRRMEAKRRRSEKQRILKEGGGVGEDKGIDLNFRGRLEREQQCLGISSSKFVGSSMGNSFGSPPNVEVKRRTTFGSLQGFLAQAQARAQAQAQAQHGCSQGSGESQGGNSSGASELESKTHQGSSSCGDSRSPASIHSSQERGSQDSGTKGESTQRAGGTETESSSKQPENADNRRRETGVGGVEDMPCVFTIGDGPNGRKVEGILYRYGKGEGVRIMCVCHGSFFSPAEFVKHAGGKDVEHPLRHIVVSPSTSPFQ